MACTAGRGSAQGSAPAGRDLQRRDPATGGNGLLTIAMTRVFEVAAALFAVAAAVFWSLYAFEELPQMTPVDDPALAVGGLAIMTSLSIP